MSGAQMPVALLEWKAVKKSTLRGFAKIRVGKALAMRDVALHVKNGRRWAQPPSRPMIGADGAIKMGDNGKPMYSPVVEWLDRESADRFSEAVIEAVEREHPGATGE